MIIERAKTEHIPGMLELLLQVGQVHHLGRPDLFRAGAQKYDAPALEKLIADPKCPIFIASEDGKVLGYAFCIFQQHIADPVLTDVLTLYIDDLCVDENCRGQHVGRSLYDHVCAFAKESGCYNVTLNVWACNESAMGFYRACGLKPQKIGMEHILGEENAE